MNVAAGPEKADPASAQANWLRHTAARHALQEVLTAFARGGIVPLVVKGIVTMPLLYDDCSSRVIGDIDLRIPRRLFGRAVRLARASGWEPSTLSSVLWTALFKVHALEVDIECTIGPPGLCALSIDELLVRAERCTEPFGFAYLRPELNDHALILVVNAFKDGLRPTPWAEEDLRRIARHSRFDPSVLVARAREARVASALWLVADWLAQEDAAAEWRGVRDRIGPQPPNRRVANIYRHVYKRWWSRRTCTLVAWGGSDLLTRRFAGFAMLAAGLARYRALRALRPY